MVGAIFPLDEELGLVGGRLTPRLRGEMSRWGAEKPFEKVVEEMKRHYHVTVSEATVRRATYESGQAAEALENEKVCRIKQDGEPVEVGEKQLMISPDGTLIPLTNGEWREVKSVAIGEVTAEWHEGRGEFDIVTENLSYFSRSYRIRDFEEAALAELHQRGVPTSNRVVAVSDGADWIQSFVDYHCPQAVRILDFYHVLEYLANAGKAVWGEGTDLFKQWFKRLSHQLKHKPPAYTIAELGLIRPKAQTEEQLAAVDRAIFYLETRLPMLDYPHFRANGYPIGSGAVESSHKFVVHKRLKQAGMRWADHHVDPMLALRNALCNDRWDSTWPEIVAYHQRQLNEKRRQARQQQPDDSALPNKPITFAAVQVAPETASLPKKTRRQDEHPWRRNLWPTREAWRWSPAHHPK